MYIYIYSNLAWRAVSPVERQLYYSSNPAWLPARHGPQRGKKMNKRPIRKNDKRRTKRNIDKSINA